MTLPMVFGLARKNDTQVGPRLVVMNSTRLKRKSGLSNGLLRLFGSLVSRWTRRTKTKSELPNSSKGLVEVPHILVLEDDDGVRRLLCRILRDQHYNLYPVESVARAFAALTERSFDGYLLDYRLQDGTGLEIAQKVRQQGSSAPITLITGCNFDVIAAEARGLDIFQIIPKPFTGEAICSTIKMAFERV
jgi:CheY-like chemotaxis protein